MKGTVWSALALSTVIALLLSACATTTVTKTTTVTESVNSTQAVATASASDISYALAQMTLTPVVDTALPRPWLLMLYSTFLWENGEESFVAGEHDLLTSLLLQTLGRLNLQAKCVFTERDIKDMERDDRVVELRFRFPEDVTISQCVEPEERGHIQTNNDGYRILEGVNSALFILEDNRGEGLQGPVLVGSTISGYWGCWAIQQAESKQLDKSWIREVNDLIGGDAQTTATPGVETPTPPAAQKIAEDFVRSSSTFRFDGIEGSITFIKDGPSPISAYRAWI